MLLDSQPELGELDVDVGLDLGIARGRNGTRHRKTDAHDKHQGNLRLGDQFIDAARHRSETLGVDKRRRGDARLGKQVAPHVEQALFDRGAADVDSDKIALRLHTSPLS